MRAADFDVLLAAAGGPGRAYLLVAIAARADDRRVAAASGQLPRQAAGGGHARHLALFIERRAVDGARRRIEDFVDRIEPAIFWNADLSRQRIKPSDGLRLVVD